VDWTALVDAGRHGRSSFSTLEVFFFVASSLFISRIGSGTGECRLEWRGSKLSTDLTLELTVNSSMVIVVSVRLHSAAIKLTAVNFDNRHREDSLCSNHSASRQKRGG
jgi:hypothetical protein